jgi:hypothetical protein
MNITLGASTADQSIAQHPIGMSISMILCFQALPHAAAMI